MRIATSIVLGSLIAACSGGSDGGFTSSARVEKIILPTYGYRIGATEEGGPLTISVLSDAGLITVAVDFGNTLNGEVNVAVDSSNDLSIVDFSIDRFSAVSVDSDLGLPFLGTFDIGVILGTFSVPGAAPTAGRLEITAPFETVSLEFVAGGVELRFGGAAPIYFAREDLENLIENDAAPGWQRRAALAVGILEFSLAQAFAVTEALNLIDEQLAGVNPLVAACDAFGGPPPAGVLAQGESTFTWMGSGSVPADGDSFQWAFTDCWYDDPTHPLDRLVNGSIDLLGYVEIIDAEFRLVGSGFDEVNFDNLVVAATEENPSGVFSIDSGNTITVNGSFDLAFVGFTD